MHCAVVSVTTATVTLQKKEIYIDGLKKTDVHLALMGLRLRKYTELKVRLHTVDEV